MKSIVAINIIIEKFNFELMSDSLKEDVLRDQFILTESNDEKENATIDTNIITNQID